MPAIAGAGLEGIVAGSSDICFVDGDEGILCYRGYNVHTLVEHATFEEVIYLLWHGQLPNRFDLDTLKALLVQYRPISRRVTEFLAGARESAPMDVLRTAVSMLSLDDPSAKDMTPEANLRKAHKLMAQTATIVTTFHRLRSGHDVLAGDPDLGLAANFLYTLNGKKPDTVMERAFDTALMLHADHELNASTFASRITASTLSDIYSAITSGIGTLKGPLHGGANEDAIRMVLEAGSEQAALEHIHHRLSKKIKIPGFGHRVYRTEDPRATHLRQLSEELGKRTGHADLYLTSKKIEKTMKDLKNLNANVDFYSASVYYSLGIPVDLCTPIFAVSRMSGWTAHILEQYRNNRLIQPRAEYTGRPAGQRWIPIEER